MDWDEREHPRRADGKFTNRDGVPLPVDRWARRLSAQIGRTTQDGVRTYRASRDGKITPIPSDTEARTRYYHGTVVQHLGQVKPQVEHRGGVTFPSDTDRSYAYATTDPKTAWHYAEMAWHATGEGIPRVYEVEAAGHVEKDPMYTPEGRSRSNYEDDVRSRQGFRVRRQLKMPESMGDPDDWR